MMDTNFILGLLQIALLDIALCADNIGIIALATRNLSEKSAKIASLLGIGGAIILRIIFAACLTLILKVDWLPINLVGGLILIKVTWDLIKPQAEIEEEHNVKESKKLWGAALTVLVADVSMSLDNVLAIAGAAHGNVLLIVFGILLNIPVIFFGSRFIMNLMNKSPIVVYIGGAILAHTSIAMILEDYWFKKYIPLGHLSTTLIALAAGVLTLLYGVYVIKKSKIEVQSSEVKDTKVS